jgi:hypothetical protein
MATDFRDGSQFPRRGRDEFGGAMWLLRLSDKGRAAAADTIGDYIYPCPMDKGVMERWGVAPDEFDAALRAHHTDREMLAWLQERTTAERIREANEWLVNEKLENLDRQDSEEVLVS